MTFFNFFVISEPRPIRSRALIISRKLQYKCSDEIHSHACSNLPGMYIKVVINLFL